VVISADRWEHLQRRIVHSSSSWNVALKGAAYKTLQTKCLQTFFALILFECLGMKNKIIIKKKWWSQER